MTGSPDARDGRAGNFILAAVPEPEWEAIRNRCEQVELSIRDVMYRQGEMIDYVYFPLSCVCSMLAEQQGDATVEVGTIGREGMAGLPAFLGVATSPNMVMAQIAGVALRLRIEDLREILVGDGVLHGQLHRYIQATMVQLSQNVACNRLHTTEERAARWLLMTADRVGAEQFTLTQEFLAQMLGVRRGTVSLTAGLLHGAGLISYRRGVITIDDRPGLEDAACECYGVVRAEFDALAKLG
ncbi:Crp/Fnr family transcriptional regulator [Actinoplanes sp. URMC 104]|uniref:Crp/Fnr family transcriptional regulator n=1 Tax=Actinoplanes sp. URMC 104 TaxID=3423409 RepID=UPI003F1D44EE